MIFTVKKCYKCNNAIDSCVVNENERESITFKFRNDEYCNIIIDRYYKSADNKNFVKDFRFHLCKKCLLEILNKE